MQSQKISKLGLRELVSSQPDSPLPKYFTPNRKTLIKETSHLEFNSIILEENSSDTDKNIVNKSESIASGFVENDEDDLSQDNSLESCRIDERLRLDGLELVINWNDPSENPARRVKLLENGEEIEDCTWSEMKRRHIEWSGQRK